MAYSETNKFNTTYLPGFGNRYVSTLIEKTIQSANRYSEDPTGQAPIEKLIGQYQSGALEVVECAELTKIIATVEDANIRLDLTRGTRAIMKHSRWNGEFANKMKNFRPYQKDKRLDFAHSLLEDGKARNTYPSSNALNIVLQNCSSLEQAIEEIELLAKRGTQPNAKSLDILINLAPDKKTAFEIFDIYSEVTGVNNFIMNSMIKLCTGTDEAFDMIKEQFKGHGLKMNHGTLLSLVSCAKNKTEAHRVIGKLGEDLGVSVYTLNANLKHAKTVSTKQTMLEDYQKTHEVAPDSTSYALIARTAIIKEQPVEAEKYINLMEHNLRQEQRTNSYLGTLKVKLKELKDTQQKTV